MTRQDRPASFPTHPVVLVEPVVHLILGAVLLVRSPFESPVLGTTVATSFVVLGLAWLAPAVVRYRAGGFSLTDDSLLFRPGLFARKRDVVERGRIERITASRGAGPLRFDPVHVLLARVVNYGSVEVRTSDGRVCTARPVTPDVAAAIITDWDAGRPVPALRTHHRGVLPAIAGLLFAAFAGGVLLARGVAPRASVSILLAGAAIFELAFWLAVVDGRRNIST